MISFLLDVGYCVALLLASPWLAFKVIRLGKYRAGLVEKLLGAVPRRKPGPMCVWFHAVSVGEVLLLRLVVSELAQRRPDVEIVLSTTTNTGMEVARQHFREHTLFYFPLDFSWAVRRAMRRIRPDLVVLAELELWPNFILAARRSGARIVIINGRMSPRSLRGYRRIRFLMRRLLDRIDTIAVQTPEYAQRFFEIGAPQEHVVVTGSVKYDGVETNRANPRTTALRRLIDLQSDELIWVAGSTSGPEEQIVLGAYEQLRAERPNLRLIIVPRHKERFQEVAELITSRGFCLVRRSQLSAHERTAIPPDPQSAIRGPQSSERSAISPGAPGQSAIILVDTLGELSAVWGLADVAFVGGSFAPRGGQNMIEPAGYGAAVLFGPGVWNFQDTVNHLLGCNGAVQVATPDELVQVVRNLACDSSLRSQHGTAARQFVLSQQGATAKTIHQLDQLLGPPKSVVEQAA